VKKTVLLYLLPILSFHFFLDKALSAQPVYVSETGFYELKEIFDYLNGPDYHLLNGRQYDRLNSGESHPFFNTERYRTGSVLLNGEAYDSVLINYDIHDQQLILQVPGWISDLNNKVVLNREWIDHFQIDGLVFRKMSFPETGTSFFQVMSSGEISCYLRWTKKLYRSSPSGNARIKYLKPSREIYLEKEDQLFPVKNRASFASIFDEAYRKEIKEYLRREKIRFRSVSDEKLCDLINFCTGLIHSG
jgi:hypothetical protein